MYSLLLNNNEVNYKLCTLAFSTIHTQNKDKEIVISAVYKYFIYVAHFLLLIISSWQVPKLTCARILKL